MRSRPTAATAPWIDSVPLIAARNTEAFPVIRMLRCGKTSRLLTDASRSVFSRMRSLLEQRGRQGFVRRCHGDLHLANIVSIDGEPVLFDAIESIRRLHRSTCSTTSLFRSWISIIMDSPKPPASFSTAIWQRHLKTISMRWHCCRYSCRCARPSALMFCSPRLDQTGNDRDNIWNAARSYFELARRAISPPAAMAHCHRRIVRHRKIRTGPRVGQPVRTIARRCHPAFGHHTKAVVSCCGDRTPARNSLST